jgi:thymidylate kinase
VFAAQVAVLWAHYVRAILDRAAGRIVLFDRYVLDGAVAAGKPLPFRSKLSRRIQRWIVPAPDLVLLLDASGRTMYERKGEYAAETLESGRSQYRKLQAAVPSLVVIDAEQPAEGVLRTAQKLIWEKLRERVAA